jgi:2-isopropylmalate synthase
MRLSFVGFNALLLSSSAVVAFAPLRQTRRLASSTSLHSQVEKEISSASTASTASTSTDDAWISKSLESTSPLEQCVVGPSRVLVYDTTLRDGTQGENVSASCEDKLKIAAQLAAFGVDYIEAGWPGSNPKDAEFFQRAQTELSHEIRQRLVAFGSTRRKKMSADKDPQIQALVDSNVPTICMVAKAHPWQVTEILRATPEENLEMIHDSVQYLVGLGKTVLVDLEHFFDGYHADPEYALKCCQAATDAGASCLVMCDTNGGTMPVSSNASFLQTVDAD